MLKKLIFALLPLAMVSATANADDDLSIDISSIQDANIEIVEMDLEIDIDQLAADAGEGQEEDAVEACFRRIRYNYRSWGCGYNYRNYGCYNYCRPLYSYRTINYCHPVYRAVAAPVYHYYWGCH